MRANGSGVVGSHISSRPGTIPSWVAKKLEIAFGRRQGRLGDTSPMIRIEGEADMQGEFRSEALVARGEIASNTRCFAVESYLPCPYGR